MLPIKRFKNIKTWIPETDIDGYDVNDDIVAEAINVDFENGFFKNAVAPEQMSYPSTVTTYLGNGYTLEAVKFFRHSERGNCRLYILSKTTSSPLNYIIDYYLEEVETGNTILLDVPQVYLMTVKPTEWNFAYINNQLKINTNGMARAYVSSAYRYATTLYYSDDVIYNSANNVSISKGWHITLRWIAWDMEYTINLLSYNVLLPAKSYSLMEDFEDTTYEYGFNFGDFTRTSGTHLFGSYNGQASMTDSAISFRWTDLFGINKLKFYYKVQVDTGTSSTAPSVDFNLMVSVKYTDRVTSESYEIEYPDVSHHIIKPTNSGVLYSSDYYVELDLNCINKDIEVKFYYGVINISTGVSAPVVIIDQIEVEHKYQFVMVAKTFDGQRNIMQSSIYGGLEIPTAMVLYYNTLIDNRIDWRVSNYEIYVKLKDEFIYYKYYDIKVDDSWSYTSPYLNKQIKDFVPTSETLNFNYGLGADVYTDREEGSNTLGFYIKDEVEHRGRSYYINGDNKLYMSHIAGNGKIQPDCFPLSYDKQFGYIEVPSASHNIALGRTSMNELLVLTNDSSYIYVIEGQITNPFRRIIAVNGGKGTTNKETLIKDLSGKPLTSYFVWADSKGIYAHAGGYKEPKNIIEGKLDNWWRENYKSSMVASYYKEKNEYWIVLKDYVLIIDLTFLSFRLYNLAIYGGIKDFNYEDGVLYLYLTDKMLYKYSQSNSTYLEGKLSTHYNTDFIANGKGYSVPLMPLQSKVLQEVYSVPFEKSSKEIGISTNLDDNLSTTSLVHSFANGKDVRLMPVGLRYNKVKLNLLLKSNAEYKIKEFGYTYTPIEEPLLINSNQ